MNDGGGMMELALLFFFGCGAVFVLLVIWGIVSSLKGRSKE